MTAQGNALGSFVNGNVRPERATLTHSPLLAPHRVKLRIAPKHPIQTTHKFLNFFFEPFHIGGVIFPATLQPPWNNQTRHLIATLALNFSFDNQLE